MADTVFRRILVPVDFSPESERACAAARRLAAALGAELVLLHVFVEAPFFSEGPFAADRIRELYESGRAWAQDRLGKWGAEARRDGVHVVTRLRTGVPHEQIIAAVREEHADLVVIGTQGRGGVGRLLLGSVADRVIRMAPCPVLAVREPDPE